MGRRFNYVQDSLATCKIRCYKYSKILTTTLQLTITYDKLLYREFNGLKTELSLAHIAKNVK